MKLPNLNEIYVVFGLVVSIVGAVYFRIRSLEKDNAKLKRESLDNELKNIEKDNDSLPPDSLIERANRYWKGRK